MYTHNVFLVLLHLKGRDVLARRVLSFSLYKERGSRVESPGERDGSIWPFTNYCPHFTPCMHYNLQTTSNNMIEKHKNKRCKKASSSKIENRREERNERGMQTGKRERVNFDSGFVLLLSDMFCIWVSSKGMQVWGRDLTQQVHVWLKHTHRTNSHTH